VHPLHWPDQRQQERQDLGMTTLKLHDDGWLKLPANLQRALGAATGDLLEVVRSRAAWCCG
jgi:hypothetical protein